jgi:hypothetical protein
LIVSGYKYLKEPTEDFKIEERKVAEFNKAQAKIRGDWDDLISKLSSSETPESLESSIKAITAFLVSLQTIPRGVKKADLVKECRKKKFSGKKVRAEWTVPVEIAYQSLIQEFNKEVAPNNRLEASPLF